MFKRINTLTIVSFLLLTSVNGRIGATAITTKNPTSHKEQVREKVQHAIEDARKNAAYDSSGRMLATSIKLPRLGKFKFEYRYDRKNRLQYIIDEHGGRTRYKYGETWGVKNHHAP